MSADYPIWDQLTFHCSESQAPFLSELLFAQEALSVTLSEGDQAEAVFDHFEADTLTLWQNTIVTALFDPLKPTAVKALLSTLNKHLPSPIELQRIQRLENEDWLDVWKKYFKPIKISDQLWVCPSWLTPPDKTADNIIVDPGQAFGTGTHSTTKLCLEWLSEHALYEKIVLDYGTGSGILAIAAKRLGASTVYATDIDPISLKVCQSNATINDTDLQIQPLQSPLPKVDVLIANILFEPLCELSTTFKSLLNPNAKVVLSGILNRQAADLQAIYPFIEWDTLRLDDEWALISGTYQPLH